MAKRSIKTLPLKQLKEKMQKLKGDRSNWNSHYQELADHILPRKNSITNNKSDGQKRQFVLLDNTGMHSNELLAGALHGHLSNTNGQWFELSTGNLMLDQNDDVRLWMQRTTRTLHNLINASNFQQEIHELYMDLCAFGTAAMLIEEDDEVGVRFGTKFIRDYYIAENNRGMVDQLYREWEWNAMQLCQEFGHDNLPKKIQEAYVKGLEDKFMVTHAVYPRFMTGEKYNKKDAKYVSQYALLDLEAELKVGTFNEFPYVVPRWTKAAGEVYGRSPGMNALPELKVLNKMNESLLIGAQKQVDPPLQMEDDGVVLPIVTRPGGLNYRRPGAGEIKPIFNDYRLDFGYQAMEDRRKRVRDTYFVNQLQLQLDQKYMTAQEVMQRTEESMRLLSPMMGRMQPELLSPMVDRVFNIADKRGMIEPAPQILQGMKLDVKYSSLIAKSQRVEDAQAVMRTIQAVAPIGQVAPQVWDNYNTDQMGRGIANFYGFPQEMVRNVKERDQIRQERAKQSAEVQQQQDAANQSSNMESVAKTLSLVGATNG
jgi:hypothetical protein